MRYIGRESHKKRIEYIQQLFEKKGFKKVLINNLESKLKEFSNQSERVRPDLIMIWHNHQDRDIRNELPQIPDKIKILWIEVVKSNFQGFPLSHNVYNAVTKTLTWKNLYDPEKLKRSLLGKGVKINQTLYGAFIEKGTQLFVYFFYVQDNSIWKCEQIDEDRYFNDII